ncbi:Exodeoxyribonuclease VII small subunit [bacterium A37T11]|nr:Exodeoxyribonuclease VII small subunit [bacterium A37T11]
MTYTEAYEELQKLVREIENGDISVDELSAKVKRAVSLIQLCRAKLSATESEVNDILAQLSNEEEDA